MPAVTEGSVTTVTHETSGASFRVHSTGATVLSFRSADGRENLFVSKKAVLDGGGKAIRGGIPICFPIFGPPSHEPNSTMPQHGFARLNAWTLASTYDKEESAGATYTLALKDAVNGRGENNTWSVEQASKDGTDVLLTYEIRIEAQQLTTSLIIKNTGQDNFDFQALLHTYLKVDDGSAHDPSKVSVHGLGGYAITDKVSGDSGHVQSYDEDVVLGGEVDRLFIHPDDHPTVHAFVKVGCPNGKRVRIESGGQVDEEPSPVCCVVWNPGPDKAAGMADLDVSEVHDMICVEPGLVGHQPILPPNAEARITQSITLEMPK